MFSVPAPGPEVRLGSPLRSIAFHPDGTLVATLTREGGVRISAAADGSPVVTLLDPGTGLGPRLRRALRRLRGHPPEVSASSLAFAPDGKVLATGCPDGTVRLWSLKTRKVVALLEEHGAPVLAVAWSPDGRILAAGCANHGVRLWAMPEKRTVALLTGHAGPVNAVAFAPNGLGIASASEDGTVRVWSVPEGRPVATLDCGAPVSAVAVSPTSRALAAGATDGASLWTLPGGRLTARLEAHRDSVLSVAFSPRGDLVVTGSADRSARLWALPDGDPVGELGGLGGAIPSVAFDPDGLWLATASHDGTARLWGPLQGAGARPTDGRSTATLQKCRQCGEPLESWIRACPACGSAHGPFRASAQKARAILEAEDAPPPPEEPSPPPRPEARRFLPIVAIALSAVALVVAERQYASHGSGTEPAATTTPGDPRPGSSVDSLRAGSYGPSRPGAVRVPDGRLAPLFAALRDARGGRAVDRAVAALASQSGARAFAEVTYDQVHLPGQRARLLRVLLAEHPIHDRLEEAFRGNQLAVLAAALENEAERGARPLRVRIENLAREGARPGALALARALAGEDVPAPDAALRELDVASREDEDVATRLAPALVLAGDGSALPRCVDALGAGRPRARALATRALEAYCGRRGAADPLVDPDAAIEEWSRLTAPVRAGRDLLARACADPRAGVAAAQEGRLAALAGRASALAALPGFARDRAVRSAAAGAALRVLLPRLAGPADADALAAFLDALPLEAREAGPGAVAGALLAADAAVAPAAARAIARGVAPLAGCAAVVPDLVTAAPEALRDLARRLDKLPAGDAEAALVVLAAFRDGHAVEQRVGGRAALAATGADLHARAGAAFVEAQLVRALVEAEDAPGAPSRDEVARRLATSGTRAGARLLLGALRECPTPLLALGLVEKLGTAAEVPALLRIAEERSRDRDPRVTRAALLAVARAGGEPGRAALVRLASGTGALADAARAALAATGDPFVRDALVAPFVAWQRAPRRPPLPRRPDAAAALALGRGGQPRDQELLVAALGPTAPDRATARALLRAIAAIGWEGELPAVRTYLVPLDDLRGEAGCAVARSKDRDAAFRLAHVVESADPVARDPADGAALAALALLRPDRAAAVARRWLGSAERLGANEAPALLAILRSPVAADATLLERFAREPRDEARRALAQALAAHAALGGRGPLALVTRLRVDPDPGARAEAAIAAAIAQDEGALLDVALALDGEAARLLAPRAGGAVLVGEPLLEGETLARRLGLAFDALAARAGIAPLGLAPGAGPGRWREAARVARSAVRGRGAHY